MEALMNRILVAAALAAVAAAPVAGQQADPAEGQRIFELVCAMCHSVQPPAKTAPPVSHAAAYYLRKYGDTGHAAAAMVAYLREPVAERSALPAHAIERFGLMPSQGHLTEAQLQAVSRYVLTLADTAHVHRGHGGTPRP
jgi:cytochrome c